MRGLPGAMLAEVAGWPQQPLGAVVGVVCGVLSGTQSTTAHTGKGSGRDWIHPWARIWSPHIISSIVREAMEKPGESVSVFWNARQT